MSDKKHLTPVFIIYVDGKRLDTEHEGALRKITVTDCLNGIASFSILFDTGEVKIREKEQIALESEVSIHLGYKDDVEEIFYGEVTGFRSIFAENESEQLEVQGNSVLHKLGHAAHFHSYENKKTSEIIKGIIESYSLKAEIDDFGSTNEFMSNENCSDINYIFKAAGMYGKQVYTDGETVFIKDEINARTDEIIFEWGKSLIKFDAFMDTTKLVTEVDLIGWDPVKNESFIGKSTVGELPVKIGGSSDWTKAAKGASGKYISNNINLNIKDTDEAKQLTIGLLQRNAYLFLQAYGKSEGNYKLRPGMRVTIKMVGEDIEGEYMADIVAHTFDKQNGYITEFKLKRNMMQ